MRRIAMVVVALLVGGLGAVVGSAPAQAGPQREAYVAITPYGSTHIGWFWIDELEGIIGCAKCHHWFDLVAEKRLSPVQQDALLGGVMAGLDRLGQARVAGDPRSVAALRAEALSHFTSAARALDGVALRAGPVGYYDPDRRTTVVTGVDWLAAADQDIVDGIGLLQRSLDGGPSPDPWLPAAVAQFDEAFQEIAMKKAIGA